MDGRKVIIVGSGLGGLECGYILARQGYKVTVLEQHHKIGGCLQTFVRSNGNGGVCRFDTGLHYVGGLDSKGSLRPLFDYFSLTDLGWKQLDPQCSDEITIGGESFSLASGHELFAEKLIERFPSESKGILAYTELLKGVGDNIFRPFKDPEAAMNPLFSESAYDYLCSVTEDPLLRKVLSGASLKLELRNDSLPLYIFAQINNSFIQSSWRLPGGGDMIASSLASSIRSMGGEIRVNAPVTALNEQEGRIVSVEVAGSELLMADWVISDAHPAETLALIPESRAVRRIYRSRISGLPNTFGMFTANICLKDSAVKYQNRNLFIHREEADLWNPSTDRTESVLVHFYPPEDGSDYATHIDILCPMDYSSIASLQNEPVGRRGDEYEAVKARKAEECIELASLRIPGLKDAISAVYTSTPLTYRTYTGTPFGSAYGIRKDWNNPMGTVLSPRTPIGNLLFTGQNLNLHGILGTSMTAVLTSSVIAGIPDDLKEMI